LAALTLNHVAVHCCSALIASAPRCVRLPLPNSFFAVAACTPPTHVGLCSAAIRVFCTTCQPLCNNMLEHSRVDVNTHVRNKKALHFLFGLFGPAVLWCGRLRRRPLGTSRGLHCWLLRCCRCSCCLPTCRRCCCWSPSCCRRCHRQIHRPLPHQPLHDPTAVLQVALRFCLWCVRLEPARMQGAVHPSAVGVQCSTRLWAVV